MKMREMHLLFNLFMGVFLICFGIYKVGNQQIEFGLIMIGVGNLLTGQVNHYARMIQLAKEKRNA